METKTHEEQERKDLEDALRQQEEETEEPKVQLTMSVTSKKSNRKVIRDMEEVKRIFATFDTDKSGLIEPAEFLPLLSQLLKQPLCELDKDRVWTCWDEMDEDGSGHINFDEFVAWYGDSFGVSTLFIDRTDFFNEDLIGEVDKEIRKIGKDLGLDTLEIEKIHKRFSQLDEDGSGRLEFQEFKVLMMRLLSQEGDSAEVPQKVLLRFWGEIDLDQSGEISFEEFARWYVRCFAGGKNPLESFYDALGRHNRKSIIDNVLECKRSGGGEAFWRQDGEDNGGVEEHSADPTDVTNAAAAVGRRKSSFVGR
jgi:Ca2+-binding EF-hand superfamily protein